MEISVYYGSLRRSGVCVDLSVFPACIGIADHGNGVFVGRASQKSAALSFDKLEPKGTKWHWYKYGAMAGNYLLMMFYTTIGGWMLLYFVKMLTGQFEGLDAEGVANEFGELMGQPGLWRSV